MKIVNLTQHEPTAEQSGVTNTQTQDRVKELLTFDELPQLGDIVSRAEELAQIALYEFYCMSEFDGRSFAEYEPPINTWALVGGAPWLMPHLEKALKDVGIIPVYAYSKRVSEETTDSEGNVVKVNKFKHLGYVLSDGAC